MNSQAHGSDTRGAFFEALRSAFGAGRVSMNAALAPLTTFKVGGPADWLLEVHTSDEVVRALQIASRAGIPVTLLGGGSNVLIGDEGVRGLVLRIKGGAIELVPAQTDSRAPSPDSRPTPESRTPTPESRSNPESRIPNPVLPSRVRADAGVTINGLVRWTINRGLGGLEAWAGTPGTVGGAVFGNAHFDGRLIGELIESVRLATRAGQVRELPVDAMEFAYDASRLQRTGEVLLSADFRAAVGDTERLRETARRSLAYRKRTQPLDTPSAGCIFQNPLDATDRLPPGVPASAGALVDRAGLKGHGIGGARISSTHANFIVNEGEATARDIRALVRLCQQRVAETFGVELREEIVFLGEFDKE